VVVVFVGTECPLTNAFRQRLNEMHHEYGPRGVQFLGINSNVQDTPERITAQVAKYGIAFPVLKDELNRIADAFGAERTPEAFVLDAQRRIRYRGRIDDRFGIGYRRTAPTHQDLALALDELLAGHSVSQPQSIAPGCFISRVRPVKPSGSVTYAKDVAPIMQRKCMECHRPGQAAPMSLLTFGDAVAWESTMREVLVQRRMPPWHADPHYGTFANDRSLTEAEQATMLAWLDGGTPKGKDEEMHPPPQFTPGWTIGQPDEVITMAEDFEVPASAPGGVPYQFFSVETHYVRPRWVQRAEVKPGAATVVHHVLVFVVPRGKEYSPESLILAGMAPGDTPEILEPGMAKAIPAGASLVFMVHYTPNGIATKDRSSIGLIFAKAEPTWSVVTLPLENTDFAIPPGADNFMVDFTYTMARTGLLIALMPHMHTRGRDFRYELLYPDGHGETALAVPRYDFNWQTMYRLATPLTVPKGTRVHCVAHFDNSVKNPNNPDPTKEVRWGNQTWEEMMMGFMEVAYRRR
jgi:hypothetical protein